jgi:hypothetical protein
MKAYGVKLFQDTFLENANIEGGFIFPEDNLTPGQLFFRTDQNKLYIRDNDNTDWVIVGTGTGGITDNGNGTYTIVDEDENITTIDTRSQSNPYDGTQVGLNSKNVKDALDEITLKYKDKDEFLLLDGGTMRGIINMDNHIIRDASDPVDDKDVANKQYVEKRIAEQRISEHADVLVPFISDGDILEWNTSANTWITTSGSAGTFVELRDTPDMMTLADSGKFVRVSYDSVKLEFHTLMLGDISNVNPSNAKNGQVLTFDSANQEWTSQPIPARVEVNSGVVISTVPGTSEVFDDINVMDWTGHEHADETVLTALTIDQGEVWLFTHDGIAYIWDGPADVTVGVGGNYDAVSSDLVKTGNMSNWIMANNGIDFTIPPTAVSGSIAIGNGANADVGQNRIIIKTADAGLRVTNLGAVQTTRDGGITWNEIDATSIFERTKQIFTNAKNQSVFTFSHNEGFLDVYYNGIRLVETLGYTEDGATGFTLTDQVVDNEDIIYAISHNVI